jgi:hypothetical protein
MSQIVLVVKAPWFCKARNRMLALGEVITDADEISAAMADRAHSVIRRMSLPHEDVPAAPVEVKAVRALAS